jgi:hypothetical protein
MPKLSGGHKLSQGSLPASLDKLPQFLSVPKGDESPVGRGPPVEYEVPYYDIWHRRRIPEVKPGITGLWQVTGRSSTASDQMVRLDLQYVRKWSIWSDIRLLLKTPWIVLTGKGNVVDLREFCHFDRREKSIRPRAIQGFLASLEMTELQAESLSRQH